MEDGELQKPNKEERSLRDLFPNLGEEQLKEVEDTFYGYLEIAWRVHERLQRERPELFDTSKGSD